MSLVSGGEGQQAVLRNHTFGAATFFAGAGFAASFFASFTVPEGPVADQKCYFPGSDGKVDGASIIGVCPRMLIATDIMRRARNL